jgi:uncharacterized protein
MRHARAWSRPVAAALLLAASAGCSGGSAPTRFYVLTAMTGAAERSAAASAGVPLGIGPITLPGYLERPQIVTRSGPDSVELAEFDRWAEPLREGIGSVLAQDVAGLVPTERVAVFPWRQSREIQYQVPVEVIRFERQSGGLVLLTARWRILGRDAAERAGRTASLTEPAGGSGYAGTVSAMSRLLARLGEEIAAEINRLPR